MDPKLLRAKWGENIRHARIAKNLTQAALGKECGVNQSTVTKWETGSIAPSDLNRFRLASVLEVQVGDLFPLEMLATT